MKLNKLTAALKKELVKGPGIKPGLFYFLKNFL